MEFKVGILVRHVASGEIGVVTCHGDQNAGTWPTVSPSFGTDYSCPPYALEKVEQDSAGDSTAIKIDEIASDLFRALMFDENDEPAIRLNMVMTGNKLGRTIRRCDLQHIIRMILKVHLNA